MMVCWFCDSLQADPQKMLHLSMYGEVDSQTLDSVTKIKYNVVKIDIDRCPLCHSKHRLVRSVTFFSLLFFLLAVIIGIYTFFNAISGLGIGLLIGFLGSFIISGILIRLALLKGIRSIAFAKKHHHQVRELLDKAYHFGNRPKDQIREGKHKTDKNDSVSSDYSDSSVYTPNETTDNRESS
jgi:hypothetical protein